MNYSVLKAQYDVLKRDYDRDTDNINQVKSSPKFVRLLQIYINTEYNIFFSIILVKTFVSGFEVL